MEQSNIPLVSVVIPTYNRANLLGRAIASVLNQTYENLECIVVDDASNDNTRQIVDNYQSDDRFVYIRHIVNRHSSATRNTGVANAKGDFIAFLDDDDEWLPTKLQKQMDLMLDSPDDVGLVYCWMDYYDSSGQVINEYHPSNRGYVFPSMLKTNCVGGSPTLLLRRRAFDIVGGFREDVRIQDDYEFLIRVCKVFEVDYVPEALVKVDYGHGLPQVSTMCYENPVTCQDFINVTKAKIEAIGKDIHKYRSDVSNYYALIGHAYGRLKNWKNSFIYFTKALLWNPCDCRNLHLIADIMLRVLGVRH